MVFGNVFTDVNINSYGGYTNIYTTDQYTITAGDKTPVTLL